MKSLEPQLSPIQPLQPALSGPTQLYPSQYLSISNPPRQQSPSFSPIDGRGDGLINSLSFPGMMHSQPTFPASQSISAPPSPSPSSWVPIQSQSFSNTAESGIQHVEVFQTLASMGFQYDENLKRIVDEEDGNIDRIIEILLNAT